MNAANAPAATLQAGQPIELTWDCRIAHNGRTCEILLAEGTTDTAQGNNGGFTSLTGEFECCTQVQEESRTVTVPASAAAGNAVLEWTWAGDGPYFDCTDIAIQAADTGGGDTDENTDMDGGSSISAGGSGSENQKNAAIALVVAVVVVYLYCNRGSLCGEGGGGGDKGEGLPYGWTEVYDPNSGQNYYENDQGVTTWDRPMPEGYPMGGRAPPPMPPRRGY